MRKRIVLLALLTAALCACDTGIREMGPNEVGVIFRKLPPLLGGGVSHDVIGRAEKRIVFPWDQIYRFTTTPRFITWGGGAGRSTIFARAKDGNEVALTMTLAYQLPSDGARIVKMMQEFAAGNEAVEALVEGAARSDIRTYMNELETLEFRQAEARARAVAKVRQSLSARFGSFGIEIISVNLDDFQFKRLAPDGSEDSTYQRMIDQIQARTEDTKRKIAEKETVKAAKQAELAAAEARRVSIVKEAEGYKLASTYRGDAYLKTKENEAKANEALGKAEVEALNKQIEALAGPGGAALLKLEIAKQLLKNDPRYVLMSEPGQSSLEVKTLDSNQLLKQLGVTEALKKRPAPKADAEGQTAAGR